MSNTIERPMTPVIDRLSAETKAMLSSAGRLPNSGAEWSTNAPQRRVGVAVLIPCFNEEAAIAKVVADFRAALPDAAIYVYDNNSTDHTVTVARAAGAVVRTEALQGKATWCDACSPTSRPTCMCWSMATTPMMRRLLP
jgi:hypothetical protein